MENNKVKLVYIFLILQPFIDLITSLMTRFLNIPITIGIVTRGLFLVVLVLYNIFIVKKNKQFIIYILSIIFFIIIYFITKVELLSPAFIGTEITYMFKYFYFPIVTMCLLNCYDTLNIEKEKINRILITNAIIYAILIIIPVITNTSFSSYGSAGKGSVGWFYAANEVGAIIVLLFSYVYILNYKEKKIKFIIYCLTIIFAMMVIGTKVSFLGMIFTGIVFLLYFVLSKAKVNKIILCIIVLVFSLSMIPILPAVSNIQNSIDNNIFNESDNIDKTTITYKVLNVLLSGRQDFAYSTYNITEKSPMLEKLFGIGFSNRKSINNNTITKLIEIDFLDIFFHYGIIGFIVYFSPLIYIIFNALIHLFKKKVHFTFYELLYLYPLLLIIGISSLAGHVIGAPSASIYLSITSVVLYKQINKKNSILKDNEITIMALHLNYGGVEQYISSLCKILGDKYKINIISTYKINEKPAFEFDKNINITYLINGSPNKTELFEAIKNKQILNIIKETIRSIKILYLKRIRNIRAIKKIDSKYIITTRYFHNTLVGSYADNKIIKIATEHNYHNNNKKYINKIIKSIKGFDYFILVTENLKGFYQDKVKNTKCIYIPNVIDSLPEKSTTLKHNNIINVGRLEPEKAQLELIDIVKELKKDITDIKLFLIGDGSLRTTLEQKIKENRLEENIILTGFISKEEMEKYFTDSKLFVMTSHTESFGLVLIEAMSYKVPCIAYDSADGAKVLLKNDVGILIQNRDKKQMITKIKKLLKDKKELTKYSANGYNSCQNYLGENIKSRWLDILIRSNDEEKN